MTDAERFADSVGAVPQTGTVILEPANGGTPSLARQAEKAGAKLERTGWTWPDGSQLQPCSIGNARGWRIGPAGKTTAR